MNRLGARRDRREARPPSTPSAGRMVGHSPAMMALRRRLDLFAATDAPVLIRGETGSGKEIAAAAVHRRTLVHYAALPNYRNYWREAGYEEEMNGVEACLAAAGSTPALDLTPVFLGNDPDRMFVGGDDIHWNARAQQLCAAACATWLRESSLLPDAPDQGH